MIIDEFLEEVKKLKLKWSTVGTSHIRCENGDCPIIALVKARRIPNPSGLDWGNANFETAGRILGLEYEDTIELVFAADKIAHPFRKTIEKALLEVNEDDYAHSLDFL